MSIEIAPDLERRLRNAAEKSGQELGEFITPALKALADASGETVSEAHSLMPFFEELWCRVPAEEMSKLPADLAEEHDHYIYGTPKRRTT